MPPPARPETETEKIVTPDDEVVDGGYLTIPPIQSVVSTASVPNFVIARKGYGKITFNAPVDLSDVPSLSVLREIVEIGRGRVSVYKDKSTEPPPGKGLNIPATVTMEKVQVPPDFETEEFIQELREKADTTFISYDVDTGVYVFSVEHFSAVDVYGGRSPYSYASFTPSMSRSNSASSSTTDTTAPPSPSSSHEISSRYNLRSSTARIRADAERTEQNLKRGKQMFASIVHGYLEKRIVPPESKLEELNDTMGKIDNETFESWLTYFRIDDKLAKSLFLLDYRIFFDEYPGNAHENLIGEITEIFVQQMAQTGDFQLSMAVGMSRWQFLTKLSIGLGFPGFRKQPDCSFTLKPGPNGRDNSPFWSAQHKTMWPSLVTEVAVSNESKPEIKPTISKYLCDQAKTNVVVYFKLYLNDNPQKHRWWGCVAHRRFEAPPLAEPPQRPYPEPVYPEALRFPEDKHLLLSQSLQGTIWRIPVTWLYYPVPVPASSPARPIPSHLEFDIERIRLTALEGLDWQGK